ncbi:MAG: DUF1491 family protein [Alphaproteobacteria bacterium]
MKSPRLKTDLWVYALIRRAEIGGAFASVARHGDDRSGTVFVKVRQAADRCVVYGARYDQEARVWTAATGPAPVVEPDADAYLQRQIKFDPDIWILEVEDRQGRHFIDEKVL